MLSRNRDMVGGLVGRCRPTGPLPRRLRFVGAGNGGRSDDRNAVALRVARGANVPSAIEAGPPSRTPSVEMPRWPSLLSTRVVVLLEEQRIEHAIAMVQGVSDALHVELRALFKI